MNLKLRYFARLIRNSIVWSGNACGSVPDIQQHDHVLIDCIHGLTRVDTARRIIHNEIKIDMDICGTMDSCDTVRG